MRGPPPPSVIIVYFWSLSGVMCVTPTVYAHNVWIQQLLHCLPCVGRRLIQNIWYLFNFIDGNFLLSKWLPVVSKANISIYCNILTVLFHIAPSFFFNHPVQLVSHSDFIQFHPFCIILMREIIVKLMLKSLLICKLGIPTHMTWHFMMIFCCTIRCVNTC